MTINYKDLEQGKLKYLELKENGEFEGLTKVQIIKLLRKKTGINLSDCMRIYYMFNTITIYLDKLTDNKTIISNILADLKKKGGFCSSKIEKIEENLCPCEEYRNTGYCHCGLYKNG